MFDELPYQTRIPVQTDRTYTQLLSNGGYFEFVVDFALQISHRIFGVDVDSRQASAMPDSHERTPRIALVTMQVYYG